MTFFKNIANHQYVQDVLQNITTGASIPDRTPTGDQTIPIMCVTGPGQIQFGPAGGAGVLGLRDPYTTCTEEGIAYVYF